MRVLWSMTSDGVVIRRVLALIDAPLPAAVKGILDRQLHRTDPVNLDRNPLTIL